WRRSSSGPTTRIIATASRSTSSSPKPGEEAVVMSRKTLRLACAVVALSYPAFAQQSPPQPGNAPAPSAKADVEQAIPLTPGMIRDLGRRVGDNKRAEEEVNTEIASPISRRV